MDNTWRGREWGGLESENKVREGERERDKKWRVSERQGREIE